MTLYQILNCEQQVNNDVTFRQGAQDTYLRKIDVDRVNICTLEIKQVKNTRAPHP